MARVTDQETTAIEKTVCYTHRPQGGGARHATRGVRGRHMGKHQDRSEGRGDGMGGVRRNVGKSLCCGFHHKEWGRQDKQFRIS